MNNPRQDVKDLFLDLVDDIVTGLLQNDSWHEVYNDIDYNGAWHERIVDRSYTPEEAIDVLREHSQYEEDDYGLWQGVTEWDRILEIKAAYTYHNVCYAEAEIMYEDIRIDYNNLADRGLDQDGEPIPVDEEGDYLNEDGDLLETPWFEDDPVLLDWVRDQLMAM